MTWKKIDGFSNYEINKAGIIKNTKTGKIGFKFHLSAGGGRNNSNHKKYFRLQLSQNGKRKKFVLHRLLATAFIPNPENKPAVNHIDGNTLNNKLENLEWVTVKENNQHAWKNKLITSEMCTDGQLRRKLERPEEYKLSMERMAAKKRGVPLLGNRKKIIDSDGNIFNCLKEASNFHKVVVSSISNAISGHRVTVKGKAFKHYDGTNKDLPKVPKRKHGQLLGIKTSDGKTFKHMAEAAEYYNIKSHKAFSMRIRRKGFCIFEGITFTHIK